MKRTMMTMLAAGAALATTMSAFAGVQLNSVFSSASLEYENDSLLPPPLGGEDEYEFVTDSTTTLGMARAEAGSDPGGAAWSSTSMFGGGAQFSVSQGLSYDSMYYDPADFDADMYSRLSITLDQEMQLDYSFSWAVNSAELFNGSFKIYRGSTYVHGRYYSSSNQAGGSSIMLGPGSYTFAFDLDGRDASGMYPDFSSGNSRLVSYMSFSEVPAPGALALLGLAGCAWRRGRRA